VSFPYCVVLHNCSFQNLLQLWHLHTKQVKERQYQTEAQGSRYHGVQTFQGSTDPHFFKYVVIIWYLTPTFGRVQLLCPVQLLCALLRGRTGGQTRVCEVENDVSK